ncbi:MAG: NDP-sugar synthase, partial [Myxococcota bacterium]
PITETVPKPLLPIGQVPLIGYSLKLLAANDITDVIVNTHHLSRTLMDEIGDGSAYGVNIQWSVEDEILGTGGALKRMQSVLDETFVVLNSDTLIDLDLEAAVAHHRRSGALATMVLREDPAARDYGAIEVDGEQRVRRILGEGHDAPELRALMFTGTHVIEPGFLEYLPPEVESCVVRYGYRKTLDNGEPLYGYVHDGFWADAGTPARFLAANEAALARQFSLRYADPRVGLDGEPQEQEPGVTVSANASVADDATLLGPVSVGAGAKIAAGATVGPNVVLNAKATVGKDATVRDSVVLRQGKIEAGGRYERSVVGRKVALSGEPPAQSAAAI